VSVDGQKPPLSSAGRLETETIKGWGFERYILRKLGPMAGTDDGRRSQAPKVERFVALAGEPQLSATQQAAGRSCMCRTALRCAYRILARRSGHGPQQA
jgi:serine protease inhibitor ecotin